jgi:4-hydroxy-tetrahydrodipicolinate reductase
MAHRVIQWSTGHVGIHALRGIVRHPDLELVGLWVHSADKVGRDAGDLCGLPSTGVAATNDVDALLALDADCVCYTATADLRPWEAVDDIARILASGKNVVSSSLVQLLHPKTADKAMVERLDAACQEGGTSCFFSGIDPGFANDLIPIALTSACERVDSVRVLEILNYDTYDQPEVLFGTMGFAQPLDATPLLLFPGALAYAWGGVIGQIAESLGVEVDEIRETHEKATLDHDVSLAVGDVPAGTMAGLRFEVQGMVGGRPAIVIEHVTRLDDAVAPEWPHGNGYRIEIKGSPSFTVELEMEGDDGDHNTGGLVATAMRLLNAVPSVGAAAPGMLSTLDLPLYGARHLLSGAMPI